MEHEEECLIPALSKVEPQKPMWTFASVANYQSAVAAFKKKLEQMYVFTNQESQTSSPVPLMLPAKYHWGSWKSQNPEKAALLEKFYPTNEIKTLPKELHEGWGFFVAYLLEKAGDTQDPMPDELYEEFQKKHEQLEEMIGPKCHICNQKTGAKYLKKTLHANGIGYCHEYIQTDPQVFDPSGGYLCSSPCLICEYFPKTHAYVKACDYVNCWPNPHHHAHEVSWDDSQQTSASSSPQSPQDQLPGGPSPALMGSVGAYQSSAHS